MTRWVFSEGINSLSGGMDGRGTKLWTKLLGGVQLAPAVGRVTGWQPSCKMCRNFIRWVCFSPLMGSAYCVLLMERQEKISVRCLPLTTRPIFCSLPLGLQKAVKYFDHTCWFTLCKQILCQQFLLPEPFSSSTTHTGLGFLGVTALGQPGSAGMLQPGKAAGTEDRDLGAIWL